MASNMFNNTVGGVCAGSPNTRRHSAGLPAGPSDISQGALTSSPAAASSKRDPAAHSQSKIQQSITKNQQLLASHSRKGHLSAYQQAGSGSSSKAVRFANSPVDVLHPDDSSSSQHEAQQTAAHVTVCEADGNLVEHMSDQQQQSVRQTRSHTTHSSAQAAPQSASGSHHKHASSNKALSPVHQTRLAASKAVTTSNSPNLPSAGLLEVAPSTVPTAAAPHATLALGQTRSGVTFAPLVASQNAAASITSAGTMPARSLHQLQQQAHPLSNRQADADIGAVVGLDTTAAMPNAAAASLQGSAQPHQRHCLHSGRPTREHSQEKNKTVRR